MFKKATILILALVTVSTLSLSAFAAPDVSPNIPKSPDKPATSTYSTIGIVIPKDAVMSATYNVSVGKKYNLPPEKGLTGNTYQSENPMIVTISKDGIFTPISNGTSYIVVTNGSTVRYYKIVVGTGTTAGSFSNTTANTTSGSGALAGYNIAVIDTTTIATKTYGQMVNGKYVIYFVSASDVKLGTVPETTYDKIAQAKVDSGFKSDDLAVWFAEQFNLYRGLSSGGTAVLNDTNNTVTDATARANSVTNAADLAQLVNELRIKQGISELYYDATLQDLANTRAKELATKFSHIRPDGSELVNSGYGENIHKGSGTAKDAYNSFYNSAGHKANMLDETYNSYAVGNYGSYWIIIFER